MPKTIKFGISLLFLTGALYVLDWVALQRAILELNPYLFGGITLFLVIEYVVLGCRWYLLVNSIAPLGFYEHLRRYFLAVFISSFTPAQVGGDVYRFYSIRKDGVRGTHLLGLLARERLIGLGSFLMFYLLCVGLWAITGQPITLSSLFGLAALSCAGGLVVLAAGPVIVGRMTRLQFVSTRPSFRRAAEVLGIAFRTGPSGQFIVIMILSLIALVVWTAAIYWLAGGAGSAIPFLLAGMIGVLVDLIRLVPITVQGVGVREASFAYLFGLAGRTPEEGFVVGAAAYLAISLSLLLAGAIGAVIPVRPRHIIDPGIRPGTGT